MHRCSLPSVLIVPADEHCQCPQNISPHLVIVHIACGSDGRILLRHDSIAMSAQMQAWDIKTQLKAEIRQDIQDSEMRIKCALQLQLTHAQHSLNSAVE